MDCNSCGGTNVDSKKACGRCGSIEHMSRRVLDLEDAYVRKHDENQRLRKENSELKEKVATLEKDAKVKDEGEALPPEE